jgi:predicted RNA binding protein YcfA (HicA-like mRNA interferase family)
MVSVPVHANKLLPTGTLAAIIDEAGMSAEEFIALL